jgi:hypothetical protein
MHPREFKSELAAQFYAASANNTQRHERTRPEFLRVTPEYRDAQNEMYLAAISLTRAQVTCFVEHGAEHVPKLSLPPQKLDSYVQVLSQRPSTE